MKFRSICSTVLLVFAVTALSAQERADEIIQKSDEVRKTESEVLKMEMNVFSDAGDTEPDSAVRLVSTQNAEGDSVIVFSYPRSVTGLAILSTSEGQWVHFPSTGRVRKIGGKARSGSVQGVGGDFSYEDLGSGDWGEDYSFTLIESRGDGWILKGIPVDDEISYSAIIMMIHREDYLPRWIEFYRGEEEPEKKLVIHQIEEFDGVPVFTRMEMKNLTEGGRTEVIITDAEINTGIDQSRFNPRRFFR